MLCDLCKANKEQESVRFSFLQKKYITQPTMMPADVITKAIINLTQALKEKSNIKSLEQIEALKKT